MAVQWATADDVRSRWIGDDLTVEDAQILTIIEDAEDTVLVEFPDLPERIDTGDIPLRRVAKVVARVVIRHLRNPEGVRQVQEGAGPFQRSMTHGGDDPGALYLTDEDRAELGAAGSGGAFTIDQTPAFTGPSTPGGWLAYGGTWR